MAEKPNNPDAIYDRLTQEIDDEGTQKGHNPPSKPFEMTQKVKSKTDIPPETDPATAARMERLSDEWQPYHRTCTSKCSEFLRVLFRDFIRHFTKDFMTAYTSFGQFGGFTGDRFMSEAHKKVYEKARELLVKQYFHSKALYLRCPCEALRNRPKEVSDFIPEEPYKCLNLIFRRVEECIKTAYDTPAGTKSSSKPVTLPNYTAESKQALEDIKRDVEYMITQKYWHPQNVRVNTFLKPNVEKSEVDKLIKVLDYPARCTQLEAAYWFLLEYFEFACYQNFVEDLLRRDLITLEHSQLLHYLQELKSEAAKDESASKNMAAAGATGLGTVAATTGEEKVKGATKREVAPGKREHRGMGRNANDEEQQ